MGSSILIHLWSALISTFLNIYILTTCKKWSTLKIPSNMKNYAQFFLYVACFVLNFRFWMISWMLKHGIDLSVNLIIFLSRMNLLGKVANRKCVWQMNTFPYICHLRTRCTYVYLRPNKVFSNFVYLVLEHRVYSILVCGTVYELKWKRVYLLLVKW